MIGEIIASLLSLLIFLAAVIAPFVYLLYKTKQDARRRAQEEAELAGRQEAEKAETAPSPDNEELPRYSRSEGETVRGYRVESRPKLSGEEGRTTFVSPESENDESLMSHIADFSSESLSSTLDKRYEGWDEMGKQAGSWGRERGTRSTGRLSTGYSSSLSSAFGSPVRSAAGPKAKASARGGLAVIRAKSPLKQAVLMSEVLGPPKALRPDW
jgi:hypothetical protein